MKRYIALIAVVIAGCQTQPAPAPATPSAPPPSEPVAEAPKPSFKAPTEGKWNLYPYVVGEPLSGRIVGEPGNSVTIHISSKKNWDQARSEGREPIPEDTQTITLSDPQGTTFQFNSSPELVGPLMVWATQTGGLRLEPRVVMPRGGGPVDAAGEVDGVTVPPADSQTPTITTPGGEVVPRG